MKKILMIILSLIFVYSIYSNDNSNDNLNDKKVPLNEIPMYGGDKITEEQKKVNDDFIKEIEKMNVLKVDVAKHALQRGWEAFNNNDLSTAIKRFNQAWLLDPKNPDVYWGFGDYLGKKELYFESIEMFKLALEIISKHVSVLHDLAYSFNMIAFQFYNKNDTKNYYTYLNLANDTLEIANKINEKFGIIYNTWSATLFYLGRYEESLEKAKRAKLYGYPVPEDFYELIKEQLKNKKK